MTIQTLETFINDPSRFFDRLLVVFDEEFNGVECCFYGRKMPENNWYRVMQIARNGRNGTMQTHRVAMCVVEKRILRREEVVDHLCPNKWCCEPAHLEIVTGHINMQRAMGHTVGEDGKRRCKRGHVMEGYNLQERSGGAVGCRACNRLTSRGRA